MRKSNQPPLKQLHADGSLIASKLEKYSKLSDQELISSLKPGQEGSLKARPDGTIVDGHHENGTVLDRRTLAWTFGHHGTATRRRLAEDEIQSWRRSGIDVVVSLLTRDEQTELGLVDEEELCRANGINFVSFPIVDRGVPSSLEAFSVEMTKLAGELAKGRNIAVHCRQGIGRAALVATGLLILSGVDPMAALERVGVARGCAVPETPEQRRWIADFARSLAPATPK